MQRHVSHLMDRLGRLSIRSRTLLILAVAVPLGILIATFEIGTWVLAVQSLATAGLQPTANYVAGLALIGVFLWLVLLFFLIFWLLVLALPRRQAQEGIPFMEALQAGADRHTEITRIVYCADDNTTLSITYRGLTDPAHLSACSEDERSTT